MLMTSVRYALFTGDDGPWRCVVKRGRLDFYRRPQAVGGVVFVRAARGRWPHVRRFWWQYSARMQRYQTTWQQRQRAAALDDPIPF